MSSIDNALLIDRYALKAQPHAVLVASVADGAAEIARLRAALKRIDRVSTGEDQLADKEALDDTETLGWIHRFIDAALEATK